MYRYIKSLWLVTLPLFLAIVFGITRNAQSSKWSRTGTLHVGMGSSLSGFPCVGFPDGRVMRVGGLGGNRKYEIYDPATGIWTKWQDLPSSCDHRMAMLLPNGKALMIDGVGEIYHYDLFADTWEAVSPVAFPNWTMRAPATLLRDGRMLAVSYDNVNGCAVYDTSGGGTVTILTNSPQDHPDAVETMLPDGRVLLIGKNTKCDIFTPGVDGWQMAASPDKPRYHGVGVLLPPPWNEVLVAGGCDTSVCELYTPDSWTRTGNLNFWPRTVPAMALLPSGEALITGGEHFNINRICELYDPENKEWTSTDSMRIKRSHHTMVILPTGKAMAIGTIIVSSGGDTCEIYDHSDGKWDTKPSLYFDRMAHTVTPLPIIPTKNCSTNVLIVGGENGMGTLKKCELYNYSLEHITITDDLAEARSHHTAVLLPSGQVLVAGGKDGATTRSSSELYNVTTQLWTTTTGAMTDARYDHTATLLKNGDVLVTGGESSPGTCLGSCEIYSGTWTFTANPMLVPRARHTAIILLNGDVLVIGGEDNLGTPLDACEIWDSGLDNWSPACQLSEPRSLHTAVLLQSGKVLVIGGKDAGGAPLSSCEIFDPDSNKWFPEGSLNTARHSHNAMLLYSGLVLVTGGNNGANSCEIWDPAAEWDPVANTHQWKVTGSLTDGRAYHSSALIPRDKPYVLAIGGKNGTYLKSIEEYDVGLGYREIWQSEITNYPAVTPISKNMDIEGTLFRGVSEADGGNYCHIVSNDHPIISLVRIGGGNWQGNGGGGLLYMPLSTSWDAAHTNVDATKAAAFKGYYMIWSIVNGIPCRWYNQCAGIEEKTGERHKATGISVSVYPNPATTKTSIKFRVQSSELKNKKLSTLNSQLLTLKIYDISGRLVRSLTITDNRTPNTEVTWNRKDSENRKVKSGIYFYRLSCKDLEIKGKFVILK